MQIFVTGGSGFVGQHLLRMLVEEGHDVQALVRSPAGADLMTATGVAPVTGDLTNVTAWQEALRGSDAVIHAAAVTEQWGPTRRFEEVNVDGTVALLAAARVHGVRRFVHLSTEAVLASGQALIGVDERHPRPVRAVGAYARTKATAEERVLSANDSGLATVVIRPRLVWGPGDTTILPTLIEAARRGRFAWVDGGRYLTSTCHVINACIGILRALEQGGAGEVYFLTDGEPIELRTFLTALAATRGVTLPNRSIPRGVAWGAATVAETVWTLLRRSSAPPITRTFLALSAQEMTVDDAKARRDIGYRPVVTRESGLEQLHAETSQARPAPDDAP